MSDNGNVHGENWRLVRSLCLALFFSLSLSSPSLFLSLSFFRRTKRGNANENRASSLRSRGYSSVESRWILRCCKSCHKSAPCNSLQLDTLCIFAHFFSPLSFSFSLPLLLYLSISVCVSLLPSFSFTCTRVIEKRERSQSLDLYLYVDD